MIENEISLIFNIDQPITDRSDQPDRSKSITNREGPSLVGSCHCLCGLSVLKWKSAVHDFNLQYTVGFSFQFSLYCSTFLHGFLCKRTVISLSEMHPITVIRLYIHSSFIIFICAFFFNTRKQINYHKKKKTNQLTFFNLY